MLFTEYLSNNRGISEAAHRRGIVKHITHIQEQLGCGYDIQSPIEKITIQHLGGIEHSAWQITPYYCSDLPAAKINELYILRRLLQSHVMLAIAVLARGRMVNTEEVLEYLHDTTTEIVGCLSSQILEIAELSATVLELINCFKHYLESERVS